MLEQEYRRTVGHGGFSHDALALRLSTFSVKQTQQSFDKQSKALQTLTHHDDHNAKLSSFSRHIGLVRVFIRGVQAFEIAPRAEKN